MSLPITYSFTPLGDEAVLVDFGNVIDEGINTFIHRVFQNIKGAAIKGITDVVPAYCSLAVFYEPEQFDKEAVDDKSAFDFVVQLLTEHIHAVEHFPTQHTREVHVPVCYEEPYSLDLHEYAVQKNIPPDEVIRLHTSVQYRVYMIGFLPGFAYMGSVADELALPRKVTPRTDLPAGSVGIAGKQTGIYPVSSPGGWQIIGRTPLVLFNTSAATPVLFEPGDVVSFYPITAHEFTNYQERRM